MHLSYLMGADEISDEELKALGIEIAGRKSEIRMLKILDKILTRYIEVVKAKMMPGFWNEIVGVSEIYHDFMLGHYRNMIER